MNKKLLDRRIKSHSVYPTPQKKATFAHGEHYLKCTWGEGDDGGWDGWMASLRRWTWVWASSGSWRWTGRPGVLRSMESQRVWHDWATELNWGAEVFLKNKNFDSLGHFRGSSCLIAFYWRKESEVSVEAGCRSSTQRNLKRCWRSPRFWMENKGSAVQVSWASIASFFTVCSRFIPVMGRGGIGTERQFSRAWTGILPALFPRWPWASSLFFGKLQSLRV